MTTEKVNVMHVSLHVILCKYQYMRQLSHLLRLHALRCQQAGASMQM